MGSLLLIALFLPFAAVPLVALLGPRLGPRTGWLALAVPVAVVAILLFAFLPRAESFARAVVEIPWIPSLGLNPSSSVQKKIMLIIRTLCNLGGRFRHYIADGPSAFWQA